MIKTELMERFLALPAEQRELRLSKLPEAERLRFFKALQDVQDHHERTKFYRMFPDTGRLRRELYKHHTEFFAQGSWAKYRAFIGGNGCKIPWSPIQTEDGERQIVELLGSEGFSVPSWDGESRCVAKAGGVFLKEFSPAFHVRLDNGEWFACNHAHRFLSEDGWISLGALLHGGASGLRYMRTNANSMASYASSPRRGGEPFRLLSGSDLVQPPSRGDVRKLVQYLISRGDEAEHRPGRIRTYQGAVRLPSRIYDRQQALALCEKFSDPTAKLDLLWSEETRQVCSRLAIESCLSQVAPEDWSSLYQCSANASDVAPLVLGSLSNGAAISAMSQERMLSVQPILPGQWPEGLIDGELGEWMFCPCDHVPLVGGRKIVAIIPLGVQPILDLTVEKTACYEAAGVVQHNSGKTEGGGYETVCQLTGLYPPWWEGKRFNRPIKAWVAGDSKESVRDILQLKLFGTTDYRQRSELGKGIIPISVMGNPRPAQGWPGVIDNCHIKHVSGGWSQIQFRSYEQGRELFQGSEVDWVWLDEQCDMAIYEECLNRFRGQSEDGRLILTFTGLKGATDVVLLFLPELSPVTTESMRQMSRARVVCPMDDVPHLSKEDIRVKLGNTSGMFRETRRTGIPYAGSGRVYRVEEESFVISPFKIPAHFALISGADFGYGKADARDAEISGGTAAVFGAYDRENDIVYVFDEYFRAQAEAPIHAVALKKHGDWVPCEGDPAGFALKEGERSTIIKTYRSLGVNIQPATKDVEPGILTVEGRLSEGKLKIMSNCSGLIQEYRMYSRDENGKIIKKNDHRLDALRYLVMGLKRAKTKPLKNDKPMQAMSFFARR